MLQTQNSNTRSVVPHLLKRQQPCQCGTLGQGSGPSRAPEPGCFQTISTNKLGGGCVCADCVLGPPGAGKTRESIASCDERRGGRGGWNEEKQQRGKQQDASWAQLLRHVTVVRRTLRTGAELPAAAWGHGRPAPLRPPSLTMNPEQGNWPQLPATRWASHGISATLPTRG